MDKDDFCFICAENCTESYFFLINLTSKKYKTKFITLIGDLINKEYELRVSDKNKICGCCCVLLEKYDEMQQETKTIKSVLSRQLANTYNLETNQPQKWIDHSKFFIKLNSNDIKYSCKMCRFVTDKLDSVNSHCMYHKIITESKIQANDRFKDLGPATKRNKPVHHNSNLKNIEDMPSEVETELKCEQNFVISEYDQETLETIIDLNLLEDESYDSNLKNSKCIMNSCEEHFKYIADYVKHLKLKHKSSLNHIFAVVRANIRKPNIVSKLMCPYCFTNCFTNELLESHVKEAHEEAAKSKLFTDRINEFVSNLIKLTNFNDAFNDDLKNIIHCKYCTKTFYQPKLYHNHLALDHRRCFVCFLTCKEKSLLRDHIISHTSHVEYHCSFCSNIYQTKSDRFQHIKNNHSEMCCKYCLEFFLNNEDLLFHTRFAHADKRTEEHPNCICDTCGASFKNQTLFKNHQQAEHQKRKIYTCSACRESFRYRFLLMDHIAYSHNRVVVDNESNFYKCYFCNQGYSSQNRNLFISHLTDHQTSKSFCNDCNVQLESNHHFEAHREKAHQDFSILVEKKPVRVPKTSTKEPLKKEANSTSFQRNEIYQSTEEEIFPVEEEQQQIMVQTEDGSVLNMNNLILTENGELIIQNLDELLPHEDSNGQIHISNLEQFLMEQTLSANTEISYVQHDEEVIIENEDGQDNLMQTYKEIFEPADDTITAELIASEEVTDDGGYIVESMVSLEQDQNYHVVEQVEINAAQISASQSTLDETLDALGDILLEVAAAAEKEKKPKIVEQKVKKETLWGRKRLTEPIANGSAKKKNAGTSSFQESEQPASNFSQAYEFFVKGFDAKKQKNL